MRSARLTLGCRHDTGANALRLNYLVRVRICDFFGPFDLCNLLKTKASQHGTAVAL